MESQVISNFLAVVLPKDGAVLVSDVHSIDPETGLSEEDRKDFTGRFFDLVHDLNRKQIENAGKLSAQAEAITRKAQENLALLPSQSRGDLEILELPEKATSDSKGNGRAVSKETATNQKPKGGQRNDKSDKLVEIVSRRGPKRGFTTKEVASEVGNSEGAVYQALLKLKKSGRIGRTDRKWHRAEETGAESGAVDSAQKVTCKQQLQAQLREEKAESGNGRSVNREDRLAQLQASHRRAKTGKSGKLIDQLLTVFTRGPMSRDDITRALKANPRFDNKTITQQLNYGSSKAELLRRDPVTGCYDLTTKGREKLRSIVGEYVTAEDGSDDDASGRRNPQGREKNHGPAPPQGPLKYPVASEDWQKILLGILEKSGYTLTFEGVTEKAKSSAPYFSYDISTFSDTNVENHLRNELVALEKENYLVVLDDERIARGPQSGKDAINRSFYDKGSAKGKFYQDGRKLIDSPEDWQAAVLQIIDRASADKVYLKRGEVVNRLRQARNLEGYALPLNMKDGLMVKAIQSAINRLIDSKQLRVDEDGYLERVAAVVATV